VAHALTDQIHIGTLRETFFVNQILNSFTHWPSQSGQPLQTADSGDFLVNGEHTFEIGGKNKGNKQIQGIDNAFIAADETVVGFGNRIPLWIFGFLY